MDKPWDHLLIDCHLATLTDNGNAYGAIENGALAWKDGVLTFAGRVQDLPGMPVELADTVESLDDAWVSPGLIDCHTHLVFGGDRAAEFEQRLNGVSYETIARSGGGIVSTVLHTRTASEDALLAQSLPRARALVAEGVSTIEIKSGYGLDLDSESKMLRVARRIGEDLGIGVSTTFLGAHAVPPEFAGRQSDYVDEVCIHMMPAIAANGLADAVDAFCEKIGFTDSETRRVFETARGLGLPVKLHADQLSDLGGVALASEFSALSADHLEYTSVQGVRAMAASGMVAVLLPGAFYALRETRLPPIELLREHGVPMAVATDLNPGTSPLLSLRLAMNMACTLFRLTPEEAVRGATVHAARALRLNDRGALATGLRADVAVWGIRHPAELCYWMGGNPCRALYAGGRRIC
ncbi:imidazolonepropionase [Tahibacter amnicola]|uniref:Imidazolonepropionase n=1 Tax=Tahibacter amnicola TaxID=2976241 RepID=A0ABY6BB47_9GAMM|nr:imidazolonepropionase [Tahibacter amnicola]UXI67080.1 imidazolonepropionase [Tahibacter amnicola]